MHQLRPECNSSILSMLVEKTDMPNPVPPGLWRKMKIIQLKGYGYWGELDRFLSTSDPDSELLPLCAAKRKKDPQQGEGKVGSARQHVLYRYRRGAQRSTGCGHYRHAAYAHISFAAEEGGPRRQKMFLIEKPSVTILTRPRSSSVGWKGVKRSLSVTTTFP